MSQKPSIGALVNYTLNEGDAKTINKRREDFHAYQHAHTPSAEPGQPGATGHQAHVGNFAEAGQVYPAIVVRVWESSFNSANLQVLLDGNDTYWATSRSEGDQPGRWAWPTLGEEVPGVLVAASGVTPERAAAEAVESLERAADNALVPDVASAYVGIADGWTRLYGALAHASSSLPLTTITAGSEEHLAQALERVLRQSGAKATA
ncbi:hypothetical protein ACFYOK_04625 [Microbispora bryophytorum]|uniref:hypothetical protein n=1 Tax=Microbispora bryophytorum TaxID=1460882 RepID=UPI0033EE5608